MNKDRIAILAGISISVFSMVNISKAQTMKNEGLNAKQEKIVTIAAFTTNGDLQKLKTALNEGLDAGLTINEIKEILVQLYAYAGFPRSLNALNTFIAVLNLTMSHYKRSLSKWAKNLAENHPSKAISFAKVGDHRCFE